MKKYLLLILLTLPSIFIQGQNVVKKVIINGSSYPQPSIENIVDWLSMSTSSWENEMKKFGLNNRRIENGCVTYGKDLSSDNFSYVISKCPSKKIIIRWSDFRVYKEDILEHLLSELEEYYLRENAGGYEYGFKDNDNTYIFNVLRTDTLTAIIVEKK